VKNNTQDISYIKKFFKEIHKGFSVSAFGDRVKITIQKDIYSEEELERIQKDFPLPLTEKEHTDSHIKWYVQSS